MRKYIVAMILSLSAGSVAGLAQADKSSPPELIQFIRDAKKTGFSNAEIQQAAVKSGWSAATVSDALAQVESVGKSPVKETPPAQAPVVEVPAQTGAPANSKNDSAVTSASQNDSMQPTENKAPAEDPGSIHPKGHGLATADYKIGGGDVLRVDVWGEPTASVASVVVRPDGKITMPLVKDISVVDLTPSEAEQAITEKLLKSIKVPDVTVIVTQINSKKIYLIGAVKKEGPIPYTYQMTVMQALSEAGGLTEYAKRKKIYVLHTENGRQFRYSFDYDAVLKGKSMELNILLGPGDQIVVPH